MPVETNVVRYLVPAMFLLTASTSSAQENPPPYDPSAQPPMATDPMAQPTSDPNAQPQPYVMPPAETRLDGPRFRFGVDFAAGGEAVPDAEFTAWMVGFDLRLGIQLNDMIGIYGQGHFSGGKGTEFGVTGGTGTVFGTINADVTLADHITFGGGFGYGVFNNPTGPALVLRAAYNPIVSVSSVAARRKALTVGFDLRVAFLGDPFGTGIQYMFGVGYESF